MEKNKIKNKVKIIAIDGTTASGKGTIARKLAQHFGFFYLNSGALYRLGAYLGERSGIILKEEMEDTEICKIADLLRSQKDIIFEGKKVRIEGADVWPIISTQKYGNMASYISKYPIVREAIFDFQRSLAREPGLVAEGRDMTSEVFTDAWIKIYLDADPEARARRRHLDEMASAEASEAAHTKNTLNSNQNSEQTTKNLNSTPQKSKSYEEILEEIKRRDTSDKTRPVSPLILTEDSVYIDTTNLNAEEVLEKCVGVCEGL